MTAAARQRRYRLNQKLGLREFRLVLDAVAVATTLVLAGRLRDEEAGDHAAIERALTAMLEEWSAPP